METLDFSITKQLQEVEKQLSRKLNQAEKEAAFAEIGNFNFERNLKAFQQYFPEIYDKFLTHQPDDKFQLILNDNDSVNIIDYDTGVPMYSEDPESQCETQIKQNIENPILGNTNHSGVALLENDTGFIHVDLMKKLGEVYNKAASELSENKRVDEAIPSLMVFGVGLGYHLKGLVESTDAKYINIFEPNEDYFFASLFVIDWQEILTYIDEQGSYLYLGIGKSEQEIFKDFYNRSREVSIATICHAWFYQHYPSIDVNEWIAQFTKNFHQFFAGFGFFDDALIGIAHSVWNVRNGMNLMNSNDPNDEVTASLPAMIIANGPSLDDEIETIKALQNKVVMFSCNSATTALVKHGIFPDFHVALERTESTYDFLAEHLTSEERSKMNLLVTNVMHPNVASLFPWTGYGLKGGETGTQLIQLAQFIERTYLTNTLGFCNPLVGNTGLSFACHLGFKEVYLFGVDNGYISNEYHHSKSSFYYDENGDTKHQPIKFGNDYPIPGNFVDTVLTDEFMSVGNTQMERLLASFESQGVNCYNCSNGAKIERAIPLRSGDIILPEQSVDKHVVIDHIKQNKFKAPVSQKLVEEKLAYKEFAEFCETMAEILEQPIQTRTDALENLLQSLRYLYSFRESAHYMSLYLIMEGEALYTSSILISLLYNFGDKESIVPFYQEAIEHWAKFVRDAADYYEKNALVCK